MGKSENKEIFSILFIPFLLLVIMWAVKIIELQFDLSFIKFGVLPERVEGLKGVFFSPFIHKDLNHLLNNSYPILILGGLLFSVYRKIAFQVFVWLFFISGFWLWIIGRPSFHIGASGIIYALASFIFASGIFSKNSRLSALSLVVIFLYGSMVWGILPTKEPISWEGHLSGFFAGIIVAIFYKDEVPRRKKYQWEIDEEIDEKLLEEDSTAINYILKKESQKD